MNLYSEHTAKLMRINGLLLEQVALLKDTHRHINAIDESINEIKSLYSGIDESRKQIETNRQQIAKIDESLKSFDI